METLKRLDNTLLLFLVGVPRSGTTLLQAMLGRHPLICTMPETHFFTMAASIDLLSKDRLTIEEQMYFIDTLNSRVPQVYSKDLLSDVYGIMKEGMLTKEFLRRTFLKVMNSYFSQYSKIFLEKTPGHIYYMFDIINIFPEAVFIHIVRNPIDVIASIQQSFAKAPCLSARARLWNRALTIVKRFRDWFPSRIIEVRYEDLVTNPESTVRNICKWLRINYIPAMVREYHKVYDKIALPSEIWKQAVKGGIKDRRDRWKGYLTSGEGWLCSVLTRRHSKYYGYEIVRTTKLEIVKSCFREIKSCLIYYSKRLHKHITSRIVKN